MSDQGLDWSEYDAREANWAYSLRDETPQPIRYLHGLDEPFVREWLGSDSTESDVHDLAGVPPGARITVSGAGKAKLAIAAIGQRKIINRQAQEVLVRYQMLVHVPLSARSGGKAAQVVQFHYGTSVPGRSGFGVDAIVRMVSVCETLGLEAIEAILAGDGRDPGETSTGYYAWVALGFDAPLLTWEDFQQQPLPEVLQCLPDGEPVDTLQRLFRVPGGALWWRQNGSTVKGVFAVASGSDSRKQLQDALAKLIQERGAP